MPITVTITVNPAPTVIATPALPLICVSGNPSIALTSPVIGTTFTWTLVPAPVNASGASACAGPATAYCSW